MNHPSDDEAPPTPHAPPTPIRTDLERVQIKLATQMMIADIQNVVFVGGDKYVWMYESKHILQSSLLWFYGC